jgi:hypothetical protein
MFKSAQYAWAIPEQHGNTWDRKSLPFHVVLQLDASNESDVVSRWVAAGAQIHALIE